MSGSIFEVMKEVSERTGWDVQWKRSSSDLAFHLHINGRDMSTTPEVSEGVLEEARSKGIDTLYTVDGAEWFVRRLVALSDAPASREHRRRLDLSKGSADRAVLNELARQCVLQAEQELGEEASMEFVEERALVLLELEVSRRFSSEDLLEEG